MTNPYFPLPIIAAAAFVPAFGGLVAFAIPGPMKKSQTKVDNYECGIEPTSAHLYKDRFPVRCYLIAMTFIIFDIEAALMYPWAVNSNQFGFLGLIAILTFIALVTVPYVYEWRRGGLDY